MFHTEIVVQKRLSIHFKRYKGLYFCSKRYQCFNGVSQSFKATRTLQEFVCILLYDIRMSSVINVSDRMYGQLKKKTKQNQPFKPFKMK